MKRFYPVFGPVALLFLGLFIAVFLTNGQVEAANVRADSGEANAARTEIVQTPDMPPGQGIRLKEGQKASVNPAKDAPDLVLKAVIAEPGTYRLWSHAAVIDPAVLDRLEKSHSKMDSISMLIAVNESLASGRYIIEPWRKLTHCAVRIGLFDLPKGETTIRIWLPEGVALGSLDYARYTPPKVPAEAETYVPKITPPTEHPRILATPKLLPLIRERLTQGENSPVWDEVQKIARRPFTLELPPGQTIGHNQKLLQAIQAKAFVYLVEGDEACGREAVDLTVRYLNRVEYGNLLDITREIGTTIYSGAWVYDWCYPLISDSDKRSLERDLMRLANQMECGWPPFGQSIVNGHGAEAQIMRDLLTLSIALYETDPAPYRYCSWRVLEQLVPMRRWEYESPRHNQGINYGNYRIQFEYYAAILLERMSGQRVFDDNFVQVPLYFLGMRLPDGQAFPDGDCYNRGLLRYSSTALIMAAYCNSPEQNRNAQANEPDNANDPDRTDKTEVLPTRLDPTQIARLMKAQYYRERGKWGGLESPVFFLLINDPNLKPDFSFDSLPLGFDTGARLGSQIVRTGWPSAEWLTDTKTADPNSLDVAVEFKGAGYTVKNHQHLDAGAFQIFYRGWLTRDLGIYHFYGLPYDMNFNKRSIAHNVFLLLDSDEKKNGLVNDGGQRLQTTSPLSPEQVLTDSQFQTGTVLESTFEPSAQNPVRSAYKVDLTAAYEDRAESCTRSFRWLKTNRPEAPAIIAVLDRITVKDASCRRFWQINTLNKPEQAQSEQAQSEQVGNGWLAEGIVPEGAAIKPGRLAWTTLLPKPEEQKWELVGGENANSVFGTPFNVPVDVPEARGWRALLEDKNTDGGKTTVFLNVLQVLGENPDGTPASPLPIQWKETGDGQYDITIGNETITID